MESGQESGTITLEIPGVIASLDDIAKILNNKAGFVILDKRSLSKNKIQVLHDGTPVSAKEWKEKQVKDGAQLSIIVPLFGG